MAAKSEAASDAEGSGHLVERHNVGSQAQGGIVFL
jgi:hypothetical protein